MIAKGKILILGCGISGLGAIKLARKKKKNIFIYDNGLGEDFLVKNKELQGVKKLDLQSLFEQIRDFEWIIKSPGIDRESNFMTEILSKNKNVISELDFAYMNMTRKSTVIGITGTNGKSTTASLTNHILQQAKLDTALVGNIGHSFAACIAEREFDYYVVEISSFQLADSNYFVPDIALILNITQDHLDRHHSMDNYASIKFKIAQNMKRNSSLIFNSEDPMSYQKLKDLSIKTNIFDYSLLFNKYSSHKSLFGNHNLKNIAAAAAIAESLAINKSIINDAVQSFIPLNHRMQYVRELDNVQYYNDSKGTTVEAAKASLLSFSTPIIWIVGGHDKGNDYTDLYEIAKNKVHAIVILAKDKHKLLNVFAGDIITSCANSMQQAVQIAQKMAWPGMVVLLSPACASFDLFKNYEERGNKFIEEVYKLNTIWE